MPTKPWSKFSGEFLALYGPPFGPRSTKAKYEQILTEFGQVGVRTTRELDEAAVANWIRAHQDRAPWTNLNLLKHLRAAANVAKKKGYLRVTPFEVRAVSKWIQPERIAQAEDVEDIDDHDADGLEGSEHLSMAEIVALLDHLKGRRTGTGPKLYALTALAAYTGARKMELLRARVKDFRLEAATWRVRGTLPLAPPLVEILKTYLPDVACRWAFAGARGEGPWTGGSPGHKAFDQLVAAGREIGIEVNFLRLRKSFATHCESWGLSEMEVMRLLRHTSVTTSRKWYRKHDAANLKRAVAKIDFRRQDAASP